MESECQICIEYRLETGNPEAICGYCECDARNRAGADPYSYVRVERLASRLKCDALDKLAEIIKIAEKVAEDECGYTQEDLDQAIKEFRQPPIRHQVTLREDDWEFVIKVLAGASWRGAVIRSKIREQIRC